MLGAIDCREKPKMQEMNQLFTSLIYLTGVAQHECVSPNARAASSLEFDLLRFYRNIIMLYGVHKLTHTHRSDQQFTTNANSCIWLEFSTTGAEIR